MPNQQHYRRSGLDVSRSHHVLFFIRSQSCSPEEAGFYLSTFKQFEHKPPTLIKERVDKDYQSMLRTALTSINKVNKTDVEILRTSIGVRPFPFVFKLHLSLLPRALQTLLVHRRANCYSCQVSVRSK